MRKRAKLRRGVGGVEIENAERHGAVFYRVHEGGCT